MQEYIAELNIINIEKNLSPDQKAAREALAQKDYIRKVSGLKDLANQN